MKEVCIWYGILNSGDGEVFLRWYLSEEEAKKDQERDDGWCGNYNIECIETFEGSGIHKEAIRNG
jgi:hypothetical protein